MSNNEFAQRWGSFRLRNKRAETASAKSQELRGKRIASQTLSAIDGFEFKLESLAAAEQAAAELDEAATEVDRDSSVQAHSLSSGSPRSFADHRLRRPASAPGDLQDTGDPFSRRPISALAKYDYGIISARPNSVLAQRLRSLDGSNPSERPSTSPSFYTHGPNVCHGYGFSVLEPHLMPKEGVKPKEPPLRWPDGPGDIRGNASQQIGPPRAWSTEPVVPRGVRSNKRHTQRAKHSFGTLLKQREDDRLEELRFQNGVFAGRWRDPVLDGPLPEEPPVDQLEWLGAPREKQTPHQRKATRIFFALDSFVRRKRTRITELFSGLDEDGSGTLEPDEFYEGLVKLGVIAHDEVNEEQLLQIMKLIDRNFDGHVSLPELMKVLDVVKDTRSKRAAKARRQLQNQDHEEAHRKTCYSKSLPVEVLHVDKSLFGFQSSFSKFMQQQSVLARQHTTHAIR